MPSLKDIRKRIASVKNTKQITRAMKMMAAAKLRRSQEAILSSRPYAYRVYSILHTLAQSEKDKHPLLIVRPERKVKLIVLAGDRGLCGGFNANIFKEAGRFLKEKETAKVQVTIECIGKKSNDFFKKRAEVVYHEGLIGNPSFQRVGKISEKILSDYIDEAFDAVYLIYNEFKSAIQQRVTVEKLIPVSLVPPEGVRSLLPKSSEESLKVFKFEPSKEEILNTIVPKHFQVQLFRSVLESVASEHGARMSAMENATQNASEMIDALTLDYNKARQAAITKELMEIVGGVEAMK